MATAPPVLPSWAEELRAPFSDAEIFFRPQPWCGACKDSPGRVCDRHKSLFCSNCEQTLTTAHKDLAYVGHADVTDRLLRVDPKWMWQPAYRDVPQEVLLAAIQTGDAEIVRMVIENAPPLRDKDGGMWIVLTVHDENGDVAIERLGYGDAGRKSGPDATKEVIGDGIRNAAMRSGVALDMWRKALEQERDASKLATADQSATAGNGEAKRRPARRRPATPKQPAADSPAASPATETGPRINPLIQALADLAHQLADTGGSEDQLRTEVFDKADRKGHLNSPARSKFDGQIHPLSEVITQARRLIREAVSAKAPAQGLEIDKSSGAFNIT